MTDEQFNALAPYETVLERVRNRFYQPYPGRAALQVMAAYVKSYRPHYHPNLGCSGCVRNLVLEVAGHYFAEKARRDAEKPKDEPTPAPEEKTPQIKRKTTKKKTNGDTTES